jgi:N utilization substance protein A
VLRHEHGSLVINLGKIEGMLPAQEQVPGEYYYPGDRIRAYLLEVKKMPQRVKIILSRTHPNFLRKLFELEVPEIAQGIIIVNSLVRESGYRTKIAVSSEDSKIDCVGACIGVRGARIRNILEELSGEKIDIIRWDTSPEVLIENALKPAEISRIVLDKDRKRAKVFVSESQQPLAIGKDGQNVRLASRLCKWEIDILSNNEKADMEKSVPSSLPKEENI